MKKLLCLLLVVSLALAPAALAAQAPAALELSPYTEADFDSDAVTMKTEYPVYADDLPETISVIITNNSNEWIEYGAMYSIETQLNGVWYKVPYIEYEMINGEQVYHVWAGGAYMADKKKAGTDIIRPSFYSDYEWKAGKYRIVKTIAINVDVDDVEPPIERDEHVFSAEFEIGVSSISSKTPYGYNKLEDLPADYSYEAAAADGAYVVAADKKTLHNAEKLTAFVEKVQLGIPCMLRFVEPDEAGGLIIADVECVSGKFTVRTDSSRAGGPKEPQTAYYAFMSVVKRSGKDKIVLSDYVDYAKYAPEGTPYLLLDSWSAAEPNAVVSAVKGITKANIEGNITTLRVYSPDGKSEAGLMQDNTHGIDHSKSFSISGSVGGSAHVAQDPDGQLKRLTGVKWLDNERVELTGEATEKGKAYTAVFKVNSGNFSGEWESV